MVKKRIYKPKNDNEFLDQLSFIRFVSGFRHSVVEDRWPQMQKAFGNFNVKKLAAATPKDINKILESKGMIKNSQKINDVISNAKICAEIAKEHGSVVQWIAKIKAEHKKDQLLTPSLGESFRQFRGIGEMTSGWLESLHGAKKDYIDYEIP